MTSTTSKHETYTTEVLSVMNTNIGLKYVDDELIVGVEGGGTSFAVSISRRLIDDDHHLDNTQHGIPIQSNKIVMGMEILIQDEFPTSDDPHETLMKVSNFLFSHLPASGSYASLGFACFGPVGLNHASSDYGTILPTTPKANWRSVNVLAPIIKACGNCCHKFDTDVNAPAMAEYLFVQQQQQQQRQNTTSTTPTNYSNTIISSLAYVTVGTGVGVGLIINCKPVHGMMHPEGGHIHVPPMDGDTSSFIEGYSWGDTCPYHGKQTVEGIASSVALVERLEAMQQEEGTVHLVKPSIEGGGSNQRASILKDLEDTHPIWSHAAFALANLCVTLILLNSIEKIVIGGGIAQRGEVLLEKVRRDTLMLLNGYIDTEELRNITDFITTSPFGNKAGLVGALLLGKVALEEKQQQQRQQQQQQDTVIQSDLVVCPEMIPEQSPEIPKQSRKSLDTNFNNFGKDFASGYNNGFVKGFVAAAVVFAFCHVLFDFPSQSRGDKLYATRIYR